MTDTEFVPRKPDGEPASKPPLIDDQFADELLARAQNEGVELLGPDGLLGQVTKAVLERALGEGRPRLRQLPQRRHRQAAVHRGRRHRVGGSPGPQRQLRSADRA